MFFGDSIWMSDGGTGCPLLPAEGVGEDGPDGPFSWPSISLPPTTGSACTMVVAVGDVVSV